MTVTLNVYFVSIRLICYLLISSDFRSAVVTVFRLVIAYVTTRDSTKHVFVPAKKLTQPDRHVCNAVEPK